MKTNALRVAGAVFLLISLLQLSRVIFKFRVLVASYEVPLGASAIAFVVALALAIWMFRSAR